MTIKIYECFFFQSGHLNLITATLSCLWLAQMRHQLRQKCVSSCRNWAITLIPRCEPVNKLTTLTGELTYCHFISINIAKGYSHVKLAIVKVKSTSLIVLIKRRQTSKIFIHFGVDFMPLDSESETIATSTKSPRTEFNVILPLKDDKNIRYFRVWAGFQIFLCEWTLREGYIARVVGGGESMKGHCLFRYRIMWLSLKEYSGWLLSVNRLPGWAMIPAARDEHVQIVLC